MKILKLKYQIKVFEKGKLMNGTHTTKKRRFLNSIASVKWENHPSVYICVTYGKGINNFGKIVTFFNDGHYETKKDLNQAFRAFTEI